MSHVLQAVLSLHRPQFLRVRRYACTARLWTSQVLSRRTASLDGFPVNQVSDSFASDSGELPIVYVYLVFCARV
jgi:hypothetical protein